MVATWFRSVIVILSVVIICPVSTSAQQAQKMPLPKPQTDGGIPLMQALKERHSSRTFSPEPLPKQGLSNMLWAACGINRPESGKRTAPSAWNLQETDIYVAMADGLYLYDAKAHALERILDKDVRAATGTQPFVKDAAVNLIYVADFSRMDRFNDTDKVFCSAASAGFIAQNVYLFCASQGLATVVRAGIDRPGLSKVMKLRPEQKITLAQTVGYPKK